MTTALADEQVINTALNMGASGYLVKPFSLDKLEAKILNELMHNCHL
jgi:response regulator of citrate/malate metabolism